ncbi:putative cytochrome P450 [Rosa chinensis]|uniref:Putative cytochrome P450 n=1 Tax=Rosa chinensis TaxID=74649 RepID=A0A2P6P818_ROSCH|nr:putative cytochrome P450 [Rosa chinensis]
MESKSSHASLFSLETSTGNILPKIKETNTGNNETWRVFFTLCPIFAFLWFAWLYIQKSRIGSGSSPPLPPGPRGLPLVGNLLSLDPDLHSYFTSLAHKYGPIYKLRLGTKLCIVVTSPSAARVVLKDLDVTFANRDVGAALYGGSDIVCSSYGPELRMLRKVCVQNLFTKTKLDSVRELRGKQVRKSVGQLHSRIGSPVNLGEQMFSTMLDVSTNVLWGGTVEEGAGFGTAFRKVMSELWELLARLNISDLYPGLARFDLQGVAKKMKGLEVKFDGIFEAVIDQRLRMEKQGAKEESNDFLTFLLRVKDDGDAETPFTMTNLKALLMNMIVAGTDTSSNTIEFAMAEIMNKPGVLEKAQQELEAVVGKHRIVEESHIHKLPYLTAVMKETLRLHPVVPLLFPHCPGETCTVGGYTIPKGSRIFINVWAIHRDPSSWENPLEFDPTRFLDSKWDYSGSDFQYFPFGSGRRICIGIPIAERMVMHLLATLLRAFF